MKLLKVISNFLFGVIALVAVYLFFAVLLSLLPTHPPKTTCNRDNKIYVSTNGVHLDIILPEEYLSNEFKSRLKLLPYTRFVAFGWGDKQFYLETPEWSDLTLPVAFRAILLKSEAAMHVTGYSAEYRSWVTIEICDTQLDELKLYIEESFSIDENADFILLQVTGYSNNDNFYEAKGNFSLFNTCNIWVNTGLKEIGIRTSVWSPFEFGVLYHLR